MRWQQHSVVFGSIEMAISSVHHTRLRQDDSALGLEIRDDELMAFGWLDGLGRILRNQCLRN
jgi:hypothetical protein